MRSPPPGCGGTVNPYLRHLIDSNGWTSPCSPGTTESHDVEGVIGIRGQCKGVDCVCGRYVRRDAGSRASSTKQKILPQHNTFGTRSALKMSCRRPSTHKDVVNAHSERFAFLPPLGSDDSSTFLQPYLCVTYLVKNSQNFGSSSRKVSPLPRRCFPVRRLELKQFFFNCQAAPPPNG